MPGPSNKSTQPLLGGLELRCPPLPQTLVEALELIDKPEKMEVGPVTEMVQRDPIVVARLLHTVNSAYYGLRHTVSSADRAVVMLGPVAVAGIVLGMHMLKLRSILEGPALDSFNRLIRHSIASAFLTRHLAEGHPRSHPTRKKKNNVRIGASFTAGLLHDFGKIILVYNFPEKAVSAYEEETLAEQLATTDSHEMEQLLFGCDHTEAGEFAARKLSFPDVLTDVIRLHHTPEQPTGDKQTDRLIRCTAAANVAAKAMGHAFTQPISWEACTEHPIWNLLLERDLTRFESADALFEDLCAQQEHLDAYVEHLTTYTEDALDTKKLHSVKMKLLNQ